MQPQDAHDIIMMLSVLAWGIPIVVTGIGSMVFMHLKGEKSHKANMYRLIELQSAELTELKISNERHETKIDNIERVVFLVNYTEKKHG